MKDACLRKLRVGFTTQCNASCGFCYFFPHNDAKSLSLDEQLCQLQIVREELGVKELSVHRTQ